MVAMKIHVEGYGCSMNIAETEQIRGHVLANGFSPGDADSSDFIVINTCAVKQRTEFKMLRRIKKLNDLAEKTGKQLIVFGCLPKVNPDAVSAISKNIVLIGPDLAKLSDVLGTNPEEFSPAIEPVSYNKFVTIVPIARGCTNFCTFCGTKLARGNIKSYDPDSIKKRIGSSLATSKEFWLTGQDTGAYGLDIGTSLPKLLESILELNGDFRIRIGMMNPHHLARIYDELIPLFSDKRLYKFLHVPLQAGSDRVLKLMRRGYTSAQYCNLVERLKRDVPNITVATDIIAGFPTETDEEFEQTVKIIKGTMPDIVNISRFAKRPGTIAAKMEQLAGAVIKQRSTRLASICRAISLKNNSAMIGLTENVYFSEGAKNGKFLGRASNYKPVLVGSDLRGEFARVEISDAHVSWLDARPVFEGEGQKIVLAFAKNGPQAFK